MMKHQMNYEIAKRRQDVRMLRFGFRRGAYLSLPYLKLDSVYFEDSTITIVYRNRIVRVLGQRLEKIYRAIDSQHLVSLSETIDEEQDSIAGEAINEIRIFEDKTTQYKR